MKKTIKLKKQIFNLKTFKYFVDFSLFILFMAYFIN